jgi:hypothetical protein
MFFVHAGKGNFAKGFLFEYVVKLRKRGRKVSTEAEGKGGE